MEQTIDTWVTNNSTYPEGKVSIENTYGTITFRKDLDQLNTTIVFEIYIIEEYRNKGLCREFLQLLIDKTQTKKVAVECVLSKILYNYLLRFKYKGKKFKLIDGSFVYKK
jgi:hypothetical protein